jgi:nuclear RNA export factor
MVECFPVPGLPDPTGQAPAGVNGLSITVHGEFTEHANVTVKRKLRSFDRTFILGPGGNNADGVGVVSDMLVVRWYGGSKAFSTETAAVQLSPEQEKAAMVEEVQRQTGMNLQFSTMCLEETGWRLEAALESFQNIRGNIPPEAFINT